MEEEVQCKENEINGESGDVRGETVDSWKERIPELLQGYSSENIWNLDETACFGRLYPIMVFAREDHSAKVCVTKKMHHNTMLWLVHFCEHKQNRAGL